MDRDFDAETLQRRAQRAGGELKRPVQTDPNTDIRHHAGEARKWADAADREAVYGKRKAARAYAEVAQAHALAAIATSLGQGTLEAEVEVVQRPHG